MFSLGGLKLILSLVYVKLDHMLLSRLSKVAFCCSRNSKGNHILLILPLCTGACWLVVEVSRPGEGSTCSLQVFEVPLDPSFAHVCPAVPSYRFPRPPLLYYVALTEADFTVGDVRLAELGCPSVRAYVACIQREVTIMTWEVGNCSPSNI